MQAKITHYNEMISVVMHFIAAITFFFVVQIMISGELSPLYVHILFVMCFAAVVGIRLFINGNIIIYMIAHFTLYFTLLAIPIQSVMFILFAVYLIALTVWSVSYWRGKDIDSGGQIPWISVTFFVISYIYSFAAHHDILKKYLLITGSIYLILFMMRFYLKGLYDLSHNQLLYKQLPMTQIVRSNSYLVGMMLVIMVLAMLVANIIDLDNLLYDIGDALIALLRVAIKTFFIIFTWIADLFANAKFDDLGELFDALGKAVMEEDTGSKFLNMLFAILKIAITVLFLIWVGRGINIRIRQYLKDNALPTDRVERIRVKENGLKVIAEKIIKKRDNEPKNPIRRRYKRAIQRFGKRLVLTKAMTVGQIEAQMTETEKSGMLPLKEAYEKERYRDEIL